MNDFNSDPKFGAAALAAEARLRVAAAAPQLKSIDAVENPAGGWHVTLWFSPPPPWREIVFTPDGRATVGLVNYGDRSESHSFATHDDMIAFVAETKRAHGWPAV